MARILIIDADHGHAANLAAELRRRFHSVTLLSPVASQRNQQGIAAMSSDIARNDLFTAVSEAEIVVVNMTTDSRGEWDLLRDICQTAGSINFGPPVLAFSHVNRGASARLRAKHVGARLIYV